MTVGFPDYARLAQQAGDLLWFAQQPANSNPSSPVIDVAGFTHVVVPWYGAGGNADIELGANWYYDQGETFKLFPFAWMPPPQQTAVEILPCYSRWMAFGWEWFRGNTAFQPVMFVYGLNSGVEQLLMQTGPRPYLVSTVSVGAGATQNVGPGEYYRGSMTLMIHHDTNATWHAHLDYYEVTTGAWVTYAQFNASHTTQDLATQVYLPPAPVRVALINDDTSTRSMTVSMGPGRET